MSEVKKEFSLIDQLRAQHAMFCAQRDQAQTNYQQLLGAIYACEALIKQHEADLNAKNSEQGESENGSTHEQGAEQTA